jgi:hypothetical protein
MTDPQRAAFEAQITAAARALSNHNADICNVNRDDNWMIYGEDFRERAKVALEAAQAADAGREAVGRVSKGTYGHEYRHFEPCVAWEKIGHDTKLYAAPPVAAINAELVEALEDVKRVFEQYPAPPAIVDTVWCVDRPETLYDCVCAALARAKEQK